jgi:hypothetical protein
MRDEELRLETENTDLRRLLMLWTALHAAASL